LDKLLKQKKSFLFYKIIPRDGFNIAMGRFWPAGRMFDTPALECNETSGGCCSEYDERSSGLKQFTSKELNDLIRDLNLKKQCLSF